MPKPPAVSDTRPRYRYLLPDGSEVMIIHDHGETPRRVTTFTTKSGEVVSATLAPIVHDVPAVPIQELKAALSRLARREREEVTDEVVSDISNLQDALWELETLRRKAAAAQCDPNLVEALEAVLLFHSGGTWDATKAARWDELAGANEATTKGLCDRVRAAIAKARGGA